MDKDFFSMTRRERRGTIVVLAFIAIIMAITWLAKHSQPAMDAQAAIEVRAFETQVDSILSADHQSKRPPRHDKSKKKKDPSHRAKPKKRPGSKPAAPRRVDPVPRF